MRYLVTARVRPGREAALLRAIGDGTLGAGSVAGGEYLDDMAQARRVDGGAVRWIEVLREEVDAAAVMERCVEAIAAAPLRPKMTWGSLKAVTRES